MTAQGPIARYIVLEQDGAWRINLNNLYYGPYENREAAVAIARKTAQEASAKGHRAQVMVAADHGIFQSIWDSTDDQAPPAP